MLGKNKFEVDILKNVAKIANLRPKIGQIPLLSLDFNGHNSIIFHPILTFFILNCQHCDQTMSQTGWATNKIVHNI